MQIDVSLYKEGNEQEGAKKTSKVNQRHIGVDIRKFQQGRDGRLLLTIKNGIDKVEAYVQQNRSGRLLLTPR